MRRLVRKKTFGHSTVYLITLFFASILIGVGYAYLNSNLEITGATTIAKTTWDVHFENLKQTGGNITSNSSSIENDSTVINFDITLENPGDYYEFTVDVKNAGTIDAMVSSLVNTGLSEEQQKYLIYTVNYSDGAPISEKQLLSADSKETIKVYIKYKDDITTEELPVDDQSLELQLNLIYVQADSSAVAMNHPVCRRATTLHNDGTNTYGSLGTKGTLTSGDAFDCDVNGDGVYDSEIERFYYVTDLDTNDNYAVLIYYNNVRDGVADNMSAYSYNSLQVSSGGEACPAMAVFHLPKTSQWKNSSLTNEKRDIMNFTGAEVSYSKFSYANYAARLLTYEEVIKGCGITRSSNNPKYTQSSTPLTTCSYLLENTNFSNASLLKGYWLENNDGSTTALTVYGQTSNIYGQNPETSWTVSESYGIRPVIEIPKTKIMY